MIDGAASLPKESSGNISCNIKKELVNHMIMIAMALQVKGIEKHYKSGEN